MSDSDGRMAAGSGAGVGFDERGFLRNVRRRSLARAVGVSAAVVVVLAAIALVGVYAWARATLAASDRIDSYYPDLVAVSHPNTRLLPTSKGHWRLPGAANEYVAIRLVGARPVAAGTYAVDYDIWHGELLRGYDERWSVETDRTYRGSALVPELRIVDAMSEAAKNGGTMHDATGTDVRALTARESEASLRRLDAAPASSTAELAVSFNGLLSASDLTALESSGATLAWGAVNVWDPARAPFVPTDNPGGLVGVPFVSAPWASAETSAPLPPGEAEADTIATLRRISSLARGATARATAASAGYLAANGFHYYGAVFTGPPAALAHIARDGRVAAVSCGLVVAPWE